MHRVLPLALIMVCFGIFQCTFAGEIGDMTCSSTDTTNSCNVDESIGLFSKLQFPMSYAGDDTMFAPVRLLDKAFGKCHGSEITPVIDKLLGFEEAYEMLKTLNNVVFVLRNGENDGLLLNYAYNKCLGTLSKRAAHLLQAKKRSKLYNEGVKFAFSPVGLPIKTDEDIAERANKIIYVLNSRETWIWPGIKIGFTFPVLKTAKSEVYFQTVSIQPKAFRVLRLLSEQDADYIISSYDNRLEASPQKHYTKGFEDHRTSQTGWLPTDDVVCEDLRRKIRRILRYPSINYVETLQFLKYVGAQRYRYHHDYFHDFRRRMFYDLLRWVNARVISIYEVANAYLGDESFTNFVQSNNETEFLELAKKLLDLFHKNNNLRQDFERLNEKLRGPLGFVLTFGEESNLAPSLIANICSAASGKRQCELRTSITDKTKLASVSKVLGSAILEHLGFPPNHNAGKYLFYSGSDEAERSKPFTYSLLDTEDLHSDVQINRHATMLPYLSTVNNGGETVLVDAKEPQKMNVTYSNYDGLPECMKGLPLKPVKGDAALFYHRLGNADLDPLSLHAGCPPIGAEVKYAINAFTWNADSVFAFHNFFR